MLIFSKNFSNISIKINNFLGNKTSPIMTIVGLIVLAFLSTYVYTITKIKKTKFYEEEIPRTDTKQAMENTFTISNQNEDKILQLITRYVNFWVVNSHEENNVLLCPKKVDHKPIEKGMKENLEQIIKGRNSNKECKQNLMKVILNFVAHMGSFKKLMYIEFAAPNSRTVLFDFTENKRTKTITHFMQLAKEIAGDIECKQVLEQIRDCLSYVLTSTHGIEPEGNSIAITKYIHDMILRYLAPSLVEHSDIERFSLFSHRTIFREQNGRSNFLSRLRTDSWLNI